MQQSSMFHQSSALKESPTFRAVAGVLSEEPLTFHGVSRALSVEARGAGILARCLTDAGLPVDVEVSRYSERVVRVRLAPPGADAVRRPESLVAWAGAVWGEGAAVVTEPEGDGGGLVEVSIGMLRVRIRKDPWGLWVLDRQGSPLLEESREDLDVWGRRKVPPLGFWMDAEVQADSGAGSSAVRIPRRVCCSFCIEPDEHFYGFGEKYTGFDKRGQRLEMWVENTKTIGSEKAYKNVPFFVSTRGYGLLVDSTTRVLFDMGAGSTVSYTISAPDAVLDLFVIAGPAFKDILTEFTRMTGRAPVPPKWSFGLWMSRAYYKSRRELEEVCEKVRALDVPCDVVNLDPYWMREGTWGNLEWDEEAFPDPRGMIEGLRRNGFRLCLWEWPYIPQGTRMYEEGEAGGFFVKRADGSTYTLAKAAAFDHVPVAMVDFSNPEAVAWYQGKHKLLADTGVAAFKTDFGEAVPEDAVFANGLTGHYMHNLYPLLYNRTVYEVVTGGSQTRPSAENGEGGGREGVVWGRSGYCGLQKYPINWGGDPQTTFADLANSIRGVLSLGMSGGVFWACDIGGFYGPRPSPELYVRWAQFGLLCSHSRCHGTTPREPWVYGEEALRIFREFAKLRYRLLPYIYTYARVASRTGLPVVRPMVLEYQDDPNTYALDLQYLLGAELLVAPIYNASGRRSVYLPEGEWVDFWTHRVWEGPRTIVGVWPLDRIPLFVRHDSIIPLAPERDHVGDDGSWEPLTLDLFVERRASLDFESGGREGTMSVRAERGGAAAGQGDAGGQEGGRVVCSFDRAVPDIRVRFNLLDWGVGRHADAAPDWGPDLDRGATAAGGDPSGVAVVRADGRELPPEGSLEALDAQEGYRVDRAGRSLLVSLRNRREVVLSWRRARTC